MSLRSAPVPACDVTLPLGLTPLSAASVGSRSDDEQDVASAIQMAAVIADVDPLVSGRVAKPAMAFELLRMLSSRTVSLSIM